MFNGCTSLVTIPHLATTSVTSFSLAWNNCYSLTYVPALNVGVGGDTANYGSIFANCYNLQSARLSGAANTISFTNCKLSANELNAIYEGLASVTSKTITVTGCWGTSSDNPTIATAKGWTVTG